MFMTVRAATFSSLAHLEPLQLATNDMIVESVRVSGNICCIIGTGHDVQILRNKSAMAKRKKKGTR